MELVEWDRITVFEAVGIPGRRGMYRMRYNDVIWLVLILYFHLSLINVLLE